jgi:hypothetical protein
VFTDTVKHISTFAATLGLPVYEKSDVRSKSQRTPYERDLRRGPKDRAARGVRINAKSRAGIYACVKNMSNFSGIPESRYVRAGATPRRHEAGSEVVLHGQLTVRAVMTLVGRSQVSL